MDLSSDHVCVLTAFATYGFRKASMADLAEAAGVSRQTLYNRFHDKETVLAWAVTAWAEEAEDQALAALSDDTAPADQRLVAFFVAWLGTSVPVVRGLPHGPEIFDRAKALLEGDGDETSLKLWPALVRFLEDQRLTGQAALDCAYVLLLASKGLILKVKDVDGYADGMGRVVGFALNRQASDAIAAQ